MRALRSFLAVTVSASLVLLSPGLGCWSALASVVGSVSVVAPAAGTAPVGAAGASAASRNGTFASPLQSSGLGAPVGSLPSLGLLPEAPVLSLRAPVQTGVEQRPVPAALLPTPALPSQIHAAASVSVESFRSGFSIAQAASRAPPAQRSVLAGLRVELPDFGKMSLSGAKTGADEDFMARLGSFQTSRAGGGAVAGGGQEYGGAARSRLAGKGGRAGAPVHSAAVPSPLLRKSGFFAWGAPVLALGGLAGVALFAGISPVALAMVPVYLGVLVPSLILHEMGHAWAADRLGDPTPRESGRMSFRPRDLLTHIDPLMTLVVPIATLLLTGFIFGGAHPVQVHPENFKEPVKDMAKVALAGPAVNLLIAAAAGTAHAALAALGVTGAVLGLTGAITTFNVMLGVFNLLPLMPLDGHHVLRWVITDLFHAPAAAQKLDSLGGLQIAGLIATLLFLSGPMSAVVKAIAGIFLKVPALLFGGGPGAAALAGAVRSPLAGKGGALALAPALLPTLAAVGLLSGRSDRVQPPNVMMPYYQVGAPIESTPEAVDLIVLFDGAAQPLSHDVHLGLVDVRRPGGMRAYASLQESMEGQIAAAGLRLDELHAYNATPVATYRRINAATLRVAASKAASLRSLLEGRGFKVFDNARRQIIRPIEDDLGVPREALPRGRGLSMQDTLKLSTADKVQAVARKLWGDPGSGLSARLNRAVLGWFGVRIPQPKVGVLDTGADRSHPLLKGVAEVKNATTAPNVDDNGHGTWVTSLILWFAPWLKSVTHYKTFVDGGASTDDILKALTMAGNDGNIIISNSWGSDEGDPKAPDSLLVRKLAEEGRIMVFAAGNNGYQGRNTVGAPAIVHYRDSQTGAIRVIAVAATDAQKKVTGFSAKGPGSPVTSREEQYKDYPRRPDAAEQGSNTEGAWPMDLVPDRVDPQLGALRAISGTSMSTPKLAGTLALLAMLFGVTETGERLDRIVSAVLGTLTDEDGQADWAVGGGFNAVAAAYEKLKSEGLMPVRPGPVARATVWLLGGGKTY